MESKTQIAVLGAGPGGYTAAFLAADLGLEVTLIDKELNPGGVCLYRGCIPSKALLHTAKLINEAKEAGKWGISFGEPKIDLNKLRDYKNNVVKKLTDGTGQLCKQRKIRYVQGVGKYEESQKITVQKSDGTKEVIQYDYSILATGSVPAEIPALSIDSPKLWDSTKALELESIPDRLLVIGGGYIGMELGSVYASLGSNVAVVEMLPGILPGADRDLVRVLQKSLEKSFEKILVNTRIQAIQESDNGLKATIIGEDSSKEEEFDRILLSVGRKPITDGLGLENTNVTINDKGFVEVNKKLQTNDPLVYAIGDIVGGVMLAHKASAEGKVAVESISGKKVAFEPNSIPAVVFTDPELAWTGITETEAKQNQIKHKVARFPWAASGRATTMDRNDGLTKLIIDPETTRLLGMGIVGSGAGELISEGVVAIEMSALIKDLALSIHPHPTLSETIMESAEIFFGQSTHLYRPVRKT
ncbi:dihydrolipoyl dehydrogenase [Bacteroidota bacterium]